ncbi:YkvA family protein [Fictibacillus iocasae]|uniref:YkvA family protein n=1 Tax=Fictibacillus iocasae TaxID=2715437 RepID=A0ABW2NLF6_9BACL
MITELKQKARELKQQLFVLYLAYHDPRTPLMAKTAAILVVAYAFSPIDLIPDFIPVVGYLDDLILLPLGIMLVLRLMPPHILEEHREKALQLAKQRKPKNWFTGALFIAIWLLAAYWFGVKMVHILGR